MRFLGGKFKDQPYSTPSVRSTRMMTSKLKKSLFDTLAPFIEGATVLEPFGGSGALGLEALGRGAKFTYFGDFNKTAIQCIHNNIKDFGLTSKTQVFFKDAFLLLEEFSLDLIDIILLCPPYTFSLEEMEKLIDTVDRRSEGMKEGSLVFFELPQFYRKSFETRPLKNFSIKKTRLVSASFVIYYTKNG